MIKYFPVIKASYQASDAVQQNICRKLLDYKNLKVQTHDAPPQMAMLAYEMEPTYTLGRRLRGQLSPDLKLHLEQNCRGAKVIETLRGGFMTFHGPGQLVLYPVLDLQKIGIKIRDYVCILEKSIISLLKDQYDIPTEQRPGAGFNGVWIQDRPQKVASVGVHVRRNITSHGLALNVNMDPFWFQQIVPCNLSDVEMTSMAVHVQKAASIEVKTVGEQLAKGIASRLGVELKIKSSDDAKELLNAMSSTR